MQLVTQTTRASFQLFHDGGRYHIETSPLIYSANQWTGFYMIMASVMKELRFWKQFLSHTLLRVF